MDQTEAMVRHLLDQECSMVLDVIKKLGDDQKNDLAHLTMRSDRFDGLNRLSNSDHRWWLLFQTLARMGLRHAIIQNCEYGINDQQDS